MEFTLDQLVIFAARGGNLELLKERVAAGGSIDYVDSQHGSALAAAIRNADLDILSWLIENGADVNAEYHDSLGPLEVALSSPQPEVVKKLVYAGAKLRRKVRPYYRERLEQCLRDVAQSDDGA